MEIEMEVLLEALNSLAEAVERLERAIRERPGLQIRPRTFQVAPDVLWPGGGRLELIEIGAAGYRLYRTPGEVHLRDLARRIYHHAQHRPRGVLRAVRRLQAAAAWCDARVAGLERAWEELRRQQARAVEALEAEAVLAGLKGGG